MSTNETFAPDDPAVDLPPTPDPLFFDDAMRSISLRVPCSDWGKMRAISERFRLRESEIFRFGLKIALERMDPLFDSKARGIDLAPLLVVLGPQLVKYFELDTKHLDVIVNGGVSDPARRIATEDLELLAMLAMPNRILYQRLQKLVDRKLDPFELESALTEYLQNKYCGAAKEA
jgi:hypothetical protein